MDVKFIPIESEIKINPGLCPDSWFWTSESINPYRGCQCDCRHCDGKTKWYNIPNFGHEIQIKQHVPEQLTKALRRLRYHKSTDFTQSSLVSFIDKSGSGSGGDRRQTRPKFILSVGGGVTDVYQPIELEKEITRDSIKVLLDFEFSAFFLTKSTLIMQDIDLIGELNDRAYACVNISAAYADERVRRLLEPYSASIDKRFETLKAFRDAGIPGGVSMMPLAPFIGDTNENLQMLMQLAQESRAEHVLIAGLTLKPGNREEFFKVLSTHYSSDGKTSMHFSRK